MTNTQKLIKVIEELSKCLNYYVDEDPTWEGGKWEDYNAPSLHWKRRSQDILEDTTLLLNALKREEK
jgi:hypothetical protein